MHGLMQHGQLTVGAILEHGRRVYGDSVVVTRFADGVRSARFSDVGSRAARLAAALRRLGVGEGDRVGTLAWNVQQHFEAYVAVPAMGAVLHTLNFRLFPEQLAYIVNHAGDRVVILDATLAGVFARVAGVLDSVEHVVVFGGDGTEPLGDVRARVHHYEELLAAETDDFLWPDVDERSAAAMCYTSGTTGHPKGVVYSHRSEYLHALSACSGAMLGLSSADRILPAVPMFHANAWGLPYAGWMVGADFILPGAAPQAPTICELARSERATVSGGVPTVWSDVLRYAEGRDDVDLSSLRAILCGGSAVPRSLMERFEERFGVPIFQAWGMTETSPAVAIARPPKNCTDAERMDWRCKSGRVVHGAEVRVVDDDGRPLPADGQSVGEIEVRGAWVASGYYGGAEPEKFASGWLRTGDVGTLDERGYIQLTDRAKDVIKSGGEWISSVDLECALMAHPRVAEAAVVGVVDDKWGERPLACVVVASPDDPPSASELAAFLDGRVACWWIPERWAFVAEIPKTSVGKFDKKALRAAAAAGDVPCEHLDRRGARPSGA